MYNIEKIYLNGQNYDIIDSYFISWIVQTIEYHYFICEMYNLDIENVMTKKD